MLEQNQHDAGFRSTSDPDESDSTPRQKMVRLSEIRQLIIPLDTPLPEELMEICHRASDLVELGHVIYESEQHEAPVIILALADSVVLAAVQYPTLFRLKAAVVKGIPGAEYSPMFNQATFGLNDISWGYLIDALELDDKLQFDIHATAKDSNLPLEEPDAADFQP